MDRNGRNDEKTNSRKRRHRFRHRILVSAAVCLLAVALAGGIVAVSGFQAPGEAWSSVQPDKHAVNGSLHNAESREIAKENFWVLLNQLPTIPEGSRECNLEYENPESNHYSARVSLYLKESGELLGSTGRVDPGSYVEYLTLNRTFAEGEYPLTVRIELFEGTSPSGAMTLEITLRITRQEKQ